MKADKWGTPAQQKRFEAGWMPAKERKFKANDRDRRCGNCGNENINFQLASAPSNCEHLGVATRPSAVCNHWREK
jgi:hypothetical protein